MLANRLAGDASDDGADGAQDDAGEPLGGGVLEVDLARLGGALATLPVHERVGIEATWIGDEAVPSAATPVPSLEAELAAEEEQAAAADAPSGETAGDALDDDEAFLDDVLG